MLNKSLPAVLTETGWARASSNNPVSEADQADWTRRAADEIWRRDPSVLAVAPFLLAGRLWEDSWDRRLDVCRLPARSDRCAVRRRAHAATGARRVEKPVNSPKPF